MYLHRDKETFKDMAGQAADSNGRTPAIVEKDYYVTLILKLLSEQLAECVFKGGTSLSKGFHVIDRFSEDIDITFKEHIGEGRRKKLKNVVFRLRTKRQEKFLPFCNTAYMMYLLFCRSARLPDVLFGFGFHLWK